MLLGRAARPTAHGACVSSYAASTGHNNAGRLFHALDELVAARIPIGGAERFSFAQHGFLAVLEDAMPDECRHGLHLRVAKPLERTG
jgi:hypothetical protein